GAGGPPSVPGTAWRIERAFGSGRTPNEMSRPASVNAPAASQGVTSSCGVRSRPENIGPKTSGPHTAPETTPKSTIDMPRARRSGGNISADAARDSSTIDCAAPQSPRPAKTSTPERAEHPAAVTAGAEVPGPTPPLI